MRPVNKGDAPPDAKGRPKKYARYQDAKTDLLQRLGKYCSYCEMELKTGLAVEHVQPKSAKKSLEREWSNFLLGCVHCNSRKGKKPVQLDECLWPDCDNTQRAFEYQTLTNTVAVAATVRGKNKSRAAKLIELVGLDNIPKTWNEDPRFDERRTVWAKAMMAKNDLWSCRADEHPRIRQLILEMAVPRGFFSVWMTVFEDDPATRKLLIDAFLGTASDCFDNTTTKLVKRPGGKM